MTADRCQLKLQLLCKTNSIQILSVEYDLAGMKERKPQHFFLYAGLHAACYHGARVWDALQHVLF